MFPDISQSMFLSLIKIFPAPGSEHPVIEVLDSLKGPMATVADCLGCSIMVEMGEGGAICYLEKWLSLEALQSHLCSPVYGRLLEAMERSSRPPEVAFYEVKELGGLEIIEKARGLHGITAALPDF